MMTPATWRSCLVAVALAAWPVAAWPVAAEASAVNVSGGVAVGGTDVVAYFTEGRAVEGSAEYESQRDGATWRFASAEHKQMFDADPEAYAPKYGGYCAWAISQGYTAPIDPEAWSIVDGDLYLNYSRRVRGRWASDPNAIARADRNWPGIHGGLEE